MVKKYELDKADPDNIKAMNVTIYPSFIFLDDTGKEVARTSGTAYSAKEFITNIENAVAPENRWEARLRRFKEDPSYANEHIIYLLKMKRMKEAEAALIEVFGRRSSADNFSPETMGLYRRVITDSQSDALKCLLANRFDGQTVMGEEPYSKFLKEISFSILFRNGAFPPKEILEKNIEFIRANPTMQSGFTEFVTIAKEAIYSRNGAQMAKVAESVYEKIAPEERVAVVWFITDCAKPTDDKTNYLSFVKSATGKESDPNMKFKLNQLLTKFQ